jgi:hypothetical protein
VLTALPRDLEFFKDYLKDYESFVRQEISYEHLRRTYSVILTEGDKGRTKPISKTYLAEDQINLMMASQVASKGNRASVSPKMAAPKSRPQVEPHQEDVKDLLDKLRLANQNNESS